MEFWNQKRKAPEMKIKISKCEAYPVFYVSLAQRTGVDVDEETIKRWGEANDVYDKAQSEIKKLYEKQESKR